jgi:hypothetical protein
MEPMKNLRQNSPWVFSPRLVRIGPLCSLVLAFGMIMGGRGFVQAAIATFTDQTSFTANLESGYYFNNFTGAGTGDTLSYSGGTGGPFPYTISASSGGVTGIRMHSDTGLGISVSTFDHGEQLIITFTGANKPTAIGGYFFWSELNDPSEVIAGTIRADLSIGGTVVESLDITSSGNSSIGFGGFTTTGQAFDSLTLSLVDYSSGFYFPTVDNFYVGLNAVPQAGGWVAGSFVALFAIGRTGFGFLRRRSATQST